MSLLESPTAVGEPVHLSPAAVVAVRVAGLWLPPQHDLTQVELNLPRLRLLQALAGDARRVRDVLGDWSPVDLEALDLDTFLPALEERRLLLAEDVAPTTAPAPVTSVVGSTGLDPAAEYMLTTPALFEVRAEGFVSRDHAGDVVAVLQPSELHLAWAFTNALTVADGIARHRESAGGAALSDEQAEAVLERLLAGDLLRRNESGDALLVPLREKGENLLRDAIAREWRLRAAVDRRLAEEDERERERTAATGVARFRVVPVHNQGDQAPLALGMILAYAKQYKDGLLEDRYRFVLDWVANKREPEDLAAEPGVFLFSDYLWSHSANLAISKAVKERSPGSVMIHGGPDAPNYPGDVEAYFAANPHVDIVVHGEGEITTAELLEALADQVGGPDAPNLSVLAEVPGLSFRSGDGVVRTGARERLADLDVIPSPFLTGLFDAYGEVPHVSVTLETNRGCPYGCTFCDWGSNTKARIRKFSLDRVLAEFEWCAEHQVMGIGLADANFGIFERDVEIAEKVVELKDKYGYPKACTGSYAKNTVKHLEKIIGTWVDGGIITLGVLSLQSMDEGTLSAVQRSNIKTEKYDSLAKEFRDRNLPLYVDLMMGLPGATYDSFLYDLQSCIDREVQAKIHETALLTNSPMNAPAYREEHKIEVRKKGAAGTVSPTDLVVISTATMSRGDFEEMRRLRQLYLLCENFGVLRQIARYYRQETGRREIDLYEHLRQAAEREPWEWPAVSFLVNSIQYLMSSPVSWANLMAEVRRFLVEREGVADDDALDSVIAVQHAILPTAGRSFPFAVELAHDYASWHEQMLDAKFSGKEWTEVVPRLRDLPPAHFEVADPYNLCDRVLGGSLEASWFDGWDLDSPVARPTPMSLFSFEI